MILELIYNPNFKEEEPFKIAGINDYECLTITKGALTELNCIDGNDKVVPIKQGDYIIVSDKDNFVYGGGIVAPILETDYTSYEGAHYDYITIKKEVLELETTCIIETKNKIHIYYKNKDFIDRAMPLLVFDDNVDKDLDIDFYLMPDRFLSND